MKQLIKKILKKLKFVRKLHRFIIDDYNKTKERNVNIDEITPLKGTEGIDNDKIRLNLLIPTLKKEHVFGGITTAIKIFNEIAGDEFDKRIILTDSDVHDEDLAILDRAEIVSIRSKSKAAFQVIAANERLNYCLPVTKNDIFIATSWWSAYILKPFIKWQNETLECDHKMIYLIQDYEPGFQAWSSRYVLADSTYKNGEDIIAIFNTKLLKDFFLLEKYTFYKEYYFEPVLNETLKRILLKSDSKKNLRKKQMIVYGRANVDRNCFEIIVGSLRDLLNKYEDAMEWDFISLGENHPAIDLGKGKQLISKGKVSLEEYANIMLESSVGLSLMVSPHPSYPPLEMSTFGVITITNTYKNKDLSEFNDNIRSISDCSFENLAYEIQKAMNESEKGNNISINELYVNSNTSLSKMCKEIHNEIQ